MRRFSIGIDIENDAVRAIVANIRTGEFAADIRQGDYRELQSICQLAVRAAGVEIEQIVGMGVAHARGVEPPGDCSFAGVAKAKPIERTRALLAAAGIASPSTVLLFAGDLRTHLMNSRIEASIAGVSPPVRDALLPGYFGYGFATETATDERDRSRSESAAFELRRIFDRMRNAGVAVRRFVVNWELFNSCPKMLQTCCDVLDARIKPAAENQSPALGAAILGCIAAPPHLTGHASLSQIIHAMAPRRKDLMYRPDLAARKEYDRTYLQFRQHDSI